MYVLDVIPLSKTAPPGALSYRSAKPHAPGTLLAITLRKTDTLGVVVACDPAIARKAELRAASFTLRGSRDAVRGSLPDRFMAGAQRVADWHAASLGAVLSVLLRGMDDAERDDPGHEVALQADDTGQLAPERVEADIEARAAAYREAIAAQKASGDTTLLVVPTLAEAAYWKKALGARAPALAVLPPEKSCAAWAARPPGLVIVERAGSGSYTLPQRPYLDVRRVHEAMAAAAGSRLMLGDLPLPLEFRAAPDAPLPPGAASPIAVLDVRRDPDDQSPEPWRAIPEAVRARIRDALERGGTVAVLGVRAGYAPAIVCRDCGQAVADERGRALTFSLEGGERIFRSADGAVMRPADTACARCGSWHLQPLGIGVERVLEEAREAFADRPVAYLAPEILRSAPKTRAAFAEVADGGVIVGTEAMLPHLLAARGPRGLALAVVVSADSLLALPFWRSRERFVRLASFFAALAAESLVLTRRPEDAALAAVRDPSDASFFAEETMLRKALRYPPYATLVSLARQGSTDALDRLEPAVARAASGVDTLAPPETALSGSQRCRTTILTIPEGAWPDPAIAARLAALPPSVRVRVDPESLW